MLVRPAKEEEAEEEEDFVVSCAFRRHIRFLDERWRAMAACRGSSSKWFFTREQLENTASRRCGVEPDRELSYRQQAANLIQDMGQRLNVYPW